MSILTKPSVSKGVPAQFSLNKANLLLHPMVQASSYFSDQTNWYRVNIIYKSSVGTQYEIVEFDASQESPTGTFLVSERARDIFQVQRLQIVDFDGGFLEIPRSDLNFIDFDIDMTPILIQTLGGGNFVDSINWGNPAADFSISTQARINALKQEFFLNAPSLVSSIKVKLRKSSGAIISGNLKLKLKTSAATGLGQETTSSNSFDLTQLLSSPTQEEAIVEFTFEPAVQLQLGINSFAFFSDNAIFTTGSFSSYAYIFKNGIAVYSEGLAYTQGTTWYNYDLWYEIIGAATGSASEKQFTVFESIDFSTPNTSNLSIGLEDGLTSVGGKLIFDATTKYVSLNTFSINPRVEKLRFHFDSQKVSASTSYELQDGRYGASIVIRNLTQQDLDRSYFEIPAVLLLGSNVPSNSVARFHAKTLGSGESLEVSRIDVIRRTA